MLGSNLGEPTQFLNTISVPVKIVSPNQQLPSSPIRLGPHTEHSTTNSFLIGRLNYATETAIKSDMTLDLGTHAGYSV